MPQSLVKIDDRLVRIRESEVMAAEGQFLSEFLIDRLDGTYGVAGIYIRNTLG